EDPSHWYMPQCTSRPRAYAGQPLVREGLARFGRQLVRVVGEDIGAVRRDEHEVLQHTAAETRSVGARLDGEDVARHEFLAVPPEKRWLVHLEPDAVAERVVEALAQDCARFLREHRRARLGRA